MVGEEEECVYPLGSPVPRKEFFMEVDDAFGMVDGPMPTPSWVPWGNARPWGCVGCGGVLLGMTVEGGAVDALGVR